MYGNLFLASGIAAATAAAFAGSSSFALIFRSGIGIRDIGESSQSELCSCQLPLSFTTSFAPVMYLTRNAVSSVFILYGLRCGIQLYHSCARCEPQSGRLYWR